MIFLPQNLILFSYLCVQFFSFSFFFDLEFGCLWRVKTFFSGLIALDVHFYGFLSRIWNLSLSLSLCVTWCYVWEFGIFFRYQ